MYHIKQGKHRHRRYNFFLVENSNLHYNKSFFKSFFHYKSVQLGIYKHFKVFSWEINNFQVQFAFIVTTILTILTKSRIYYDSVIHIFWFEISKNTFQTVFIIISPFFLLKGYSNITWHSWGEVRDSVIKHKGKESQTVKCDIFSKF
jgi:hypothetical protein